MVGLPLHKKFPCRLKRKRFQPRGSMCKKVEGASAVLVMELFDGCCDWAKRVAQRVTVEIVLASSRRFQNYSV